MVCHPLRKSWTILLACGLWMVPAAVAQERSPVARPQPADEADVLPSYAGTPPAVKVPWEQVPAAVRDQVRKVVEQPKLFARGTPEEFYGRRSLYEWLLEHPDRAAHVWRRLGANCVEITDRGAGHFGVNDGQGTDVCWETVYNSPELRVWFCEAIAKPRPLLRAVPVKAVVLLHHSDRTDAAGRTLIRHQADLYLHTDSKSALLITRLLGATGPRMAEQCANQLQDFFSDLIGYLERYPELQGALMARPEPRLSPVRREPSRLPPAAGPSAPKAAPPR